jgi:hypothetical protein
LVKNALENRFTPRMFDILSQAMNPRMEVDEEPFTGENTSSGGDLN